MRIGISIHHGLDKNSGAPGATLDLADAYRDLGAKVSVASFDLLPHWMPAQAKAVAFPWCLAASLGRRPAYDVLDFSTGDSWAWRRFAARRASRPLVAVTSHGLEHSAHRSILEEVRLGHAKVRRRYHAYHGGWRLWEVHESLRTADVAFFVNRVDRNFAVENLGVSLERTRVMPNGLAAHLIGLPRTARRENRPKMITQLGGWLHIKGKEYCARALTMLLAKHPFWEARLLGTGLPASEVLNAFPPEVRPRIHAVPRYSREALPRLLDGCDYLLSSSISEGFSISIVEGMACSLIPIAASTPGACEIIEDGRNGLLVPPRSPSAIAEAVDRLASSHEYAETLRRRAYESAQTYGWRKVARRRMAVYSEIRC